MHVLTSDYTHLCCKLLLVMGKIRACRDAGVQFRTTETKPNPNPNPNHNPNPKAHDIE